MSLDGKKTISSRQIRRTARARSKILGTKDRPRLSVFCSNKYLWAQVIDDAKGSTILAASEQEIKKGGTKSVRAEALGALVAEKCKKIGVSKVVFDRGSGQYSGRTKTFAEAARKAGLVF